MASHPKDPNHFGPTISALLKPSKSLAEIKRKTFTILVLLNLNESP